MIVDPFPSMGPAVASARVDGAYADGPGSYERGEYRPSSGAANLVYLVVPRSDAFPDHDYMHYRHGLFGGTLARSYVAVTRGGATTVLPVRHRGHSADPHDSAACPAGVDVEVDLGDSAVSSADVAAAFVSALTGAGIPADVYPTLAANGRSIVRIEADTLFIPPPVDFIDRQRRHIVGLVRDTWSGADTNNANGGTGATVLMTHLGEPNPELGTSYRVLAGHYWQVGGLNAIVAAGSGPVHSATPASFDVEAQVEITDAPNAPGDQDSNFTAAAFPNAPVMASTDELWVLMANNATPGVLPRYRLSTASPRGWGSIPTAENGLWETTVGDPDPFGATYTPANHNNAGIGWAHGLFVEYPDASGNYHADGSVRLRIGEQSDALHGSPFYATNANLQNEMTLHRTRWGPWTDVYLTTVARWMGVVGAGEDSRVAWVGFDDLGNPQAGTPSSDSPPVHYDLGPMGLSVSNGWNVLEIDPPLAVGTDALSSTYMGIGFNYCPVQVDTTLPVWFDSSYTDRWETYGFTDSVEVWHDDLLPFNNRAPRVGLNEYQLVNVPGIPISDVDTPYPATLHAAGVLGGGTLGSPPAAACDYVIIESEGYTEWTP